VLKEELQAKDMALQDVAELTQDLAMADAKLADFQSKMIEATATIANTEDRVALTEAARDEVGQNLKQAEQSAVRRQEQQQQKQRQAIAEAEAEAATLLSDQAQSAAEAARHMVGLEREQASVQFTRLGRERDEAIGQAVAATAGLERAGARIRELAERCVPHL
jgi:hypothetical protein